MNKFQLLSEIVNVVDDIPYLERMKQKLENEKTRISNRLAKITNPQDLAYMTMQAKMIQRKHDHISQLLAQKKSTMVNLRKG